MRLLLATLLIATAGCAPASPTATASDPAPQAAGPVFAGPMMADPVFDAPTLLQAVHDRHAATWYRTLSATQRVSRRTAGGISVEIWHTWMALPGRLRIERGGPMAGTDLLLVSDTTYVYRDGALTEATPGHNLLLLWGFSAYVQDPVATLAVLEDEGFDLGAFREDVWDGKRAYVLGVPETGEVWIERDRLLVARLVEPGDDGTTQDIRFENYQRLGGGWIALYVSVRVDGEIVSWATTSDMVPSPDLKPVLFDPHRWADGVAASR